MTSARPSAAARPLLLVAGLLVTVTALSYALVLHLLNLVPFLVLGAALLGPGALRRRGRDGP